MVIDRDPAHPLFAAADHASDAEFEWREHRSQGAAVLRQHNSGAEKYGADAGVFGAARFGFPSFGNFREEIIAGGARFCYFFVTPFTIKSDCRRSNQILWRTGSGK